MQNFGPVLLPTLDQFYKQSTKVFCKENIAKLYFFVSNVIEVIVVVISAIFVEKVVSVFLLFCIFLRSPLVDSVESWNKARLENEITEVIGKTNGSGKKLKQRRIDSHCQTLRQRLLSRYVENRKWPRAMNARHPSTRLIDYFG